MNAADHVRESFVWLTAFRVRPPVPDPGGRGVLPWAPVVGVALGGGAGAVGWAGSTYAAPLVGAVLAVAALALATRGLHLDGLADTADGLGPLRGRERALQVMRSGDVGPFGVATLVLVLLLQVACAASLLPSGGGWQAIAVAVLVSRLALTRAGLPGVPVAEGSAMAAAVAGTVSRRWFAGCVVAVALAVASAAEGDPVRGLLLGASAVLGLLAGEVLHRHARSRLGGVNGDVLGATAEVTTAATLLAAAVLLPLG
ncbi:adenosylcobinamide-GDP ribazoletransferase [Klenkia brasiliensis]|uniref:Adenosylcobinamide-GDP ribazoletransferase n=1 Tax=Klenkia brasiliensis TaxID=333142 RepID=A0A1G7MC46_9ACTN|nr:adenosylcobinamide-GDP ribazoletransferase [Klenkia brasiliensis]SDF59357.1 cobalamin-5'-phosphate synthase [Klenkia brasiliensis]